MEECRVAFDAEQKKCFHKQEKKISKKIDTKLSNLSFVVEDKLNAHQKKNGKCQKHGADDNNLDSDMYEVDAVCYNRDALTSNGDGQGGV
eukprot:1655315-Ditylum_brightwellii.AAC.1